MKNDWISWRGGDLCLIETKKINSMRVLARDTDWPYWSSLQTSDPSPRVSGFDTTATMTRLSRVAADTARVQNGRNWRLETRSIPGMDRGRNRSFETRLVGELNVLHFKTKYLMQTACIAALGEFQILDRSLQSPPPIELP
jgi:hypothetical protein